MAERVALGQGGRWEGAGAGTDGRPSPAPPLQGSAPGSAEDYALHNLVPQTNYTATVRGLRGPNLTSPASITFTAGRAWGTGRAAGAGGARGGAASP